ncbi:MAG: hypothetical protein E7204_05000 [Veillonella sp.]|uniref:HK97 gp10 family phage protein n=1 Tax=Veillonella sp. TaxID=1926307 RepID=UPI0025F9C949|nr:HK97 gp10 family phage protein [Veillonella sp.]MBE6080185.1 hypothetical protein [Veillonella sp.]
MSGNMSADELVEFSKELLRLGQEQFPRKTKNFMQRAGNRQLKLAREQYKDDLAKDSNKKTIYGKARYKTVNGKRKRIDLVGSLQRGSAYIYQGNEYQVRVKNKAPHAHLFEHGHKTNAVKPNKMKWVPGRNSMGKAARKFANEYSDMADAFIDELLESGLK